MTSPDMAAAPDNALKHIFDVACFERVAALLRQAAPTCDTQAFLRSALDGLDSLSLMARLRRMADCLHAVLPENYSDTLLILKEIVPSIKPVFATLALPDFVARYGLHSFDESMMALKFFTPFGSSEYGIRPFIQQDPDRALAIISKWVHDADPHVRRLASEGTRPRLPWSFHLPDLANDPDRVGALLDALKQDDSLYVRKSVANHLNDITKLHPTWVMDRLETWPTDDPHCAWIARHALRTLIKRGDKRALAIIGVAGAAAVTLHDFTVAPQKLQLGDRLTLSVDIESISDKPQKLEIDYVVHYVKKNGSATAKVFKLRALTLAPGARITLSRAQVIRDFSTRTHSAGRHTVALNINGDTSSQSYFDLDI